MAPSAFRGQVLRALWEIALRWRGRTLLALALLVAAKLSAVAVPIVLKAIVDRFSQPQSLAEPALPGLPGVAPALVLPVFLLLGYALLRFAGTLLTELRDLVFARVARRAVTDYAERTFGHLLALGPRFHHQRETGALIRDVERGTAGIGFLLGAALFTVVPTLVEFIAIVTVMSVSYSLHYTLVLVATFIAYAGLTTTLTHKRALRQRRVNELDSRANARMVDSLLNYEAVKLHAAEAHERTRYAEHLAQWVEGSVRNQRSLSRLHAAQSAVIAAGVAAVMLLAGAQTLRGTLTVGDLVLVNAYVIQVCLPLNALGFVFREARDALVDTEKLFALLAQRDETEQAQGLAPLDVQGGAVAFEHVSFGYEAARPVLHDVSLAIEPGATLAVVGGSGSGKSTLARLLLRLYEPDAGRVSIDGQDLRTVQPASVRRAIGVVPQDTALFNDTIAYNIGYGRPDAGMAAVIEAARAAQLHGFIESLPQGYETRVGERGVTLSGGERQRLAIARAFLKNPPLLVLDEATSALDARAERAIQGELDRVAQGRTTLVIAHRLSTIVGADRIVVMEHGRVVESGRHDELLLRDGMYAQLWRLQQEQRHLDRVQRRVARQPLDLAALVRVQVDALRADAQARGVQVSSEIASEPVPVLADATALGDALHALATHALAATPDGQRVEFRLQRDATQVRLEVTDSRHAGGAGAAPVVALDPLALRAAVEREGGRLDVGEAPGGRGVRHAVELPLL
jgi:ATP-binding cassette subfamily B protein